MAMNYSIKPNRIKRAFFRNFELEENGTLRTAEGQQDCSVYFLPLDSATQDAEWGRLKFSSDFQGDMTYYVYALAVNEDQVYRKGRPVRIIDMLMDPEESDSLKREFFERAGAIRYVGKNDVLLYKQKGRYLYIAIRAFGEGSGAIRNIKVDRQGDNFMDTFPQIYQERDSFFHRYISVFSSLYNDFGEEISRVPEFLDVDTCPMQLLPLYGRWLGIDVSDDFMDERALRLLVKEAYQLNRMKGTAAVISRICQIILDREVQLIERNIIGENSDGNVLEEGVQFYGVTPYDVSVLVDGEIPEVTKCQLELLLDQFKPIRCRIRLICLEKKGMLDSYSYLDMNAKVFETKQGDLDGKQSLDSFIVLQ